MRDRETESERDRWRERRTDGQTQREREIRRDRQRQRQRNRGTGRGRQTRCKGKADPGCRVLGPEGGGEAGTQARQGSREPGWKDEASQPRGHRAWSLDVGSRSNVLNEGRAGTFI